MLSPATLAALHRLVATLLALVDALAVSVDGAPRPLAMRLATGALSAYLNRLAAHLTETANQITADPAPKPRPACTRPVRAGYKLPPLIVRCPSPPEPTANTIHIEIERAAPPPKLAPFVTIS